MRPRRMRPAGLEPRVRRHWMRPALAALVQILVAVIVVVAYVTVLTHGFKSF